MPKSVNSDTTPKGLKPYKFHGLDLTYNDGDKDATCECPFCGKPGKFSINAETSQWRCWSCNEGFDKKGKDGEIRTIRGGNATEFLRILWKYCYDSTSDYSELVEMRGLLGSDVLARWQIVRSFLTGEWLVPAYNIKGEMTQIYRYVGLKNPETGEWKKKLLPTPEVGGHGIFGMHKFDRKKPTIDVFEAWNGPAFQEVISQALYKEDGPWEVTHDGRLSVAAGRNVIAFPGCAVLDDKWLSLFKDKDVNFWFDNDHPRLNERSGKMIAGAGPTYGARNAAALKRIARSVKVLRWGALGYDPDIPSGHDVRDSLTPSDTIEDRIETVMWLDEMLVPAETPVTKPAEGSDHVEQPPDVDEKAARLMPLECIDFATVTRSWRKALRWRQGLEDALAVCLAVCLSTEQVGDQLFLMLIADAGSGKTEFCDALLVSEGCHALEGLTGFHSGFNGGGYSLLERINRKTWITAEGDVLMSNPMFQQIMSQQRRIYDGKSSASYKNMKEDDNFAGLRTPWIMAGTPALLDSDQSRLGDRFLKFFIEQPEADERRQILRRCAHSAMGAVRIKSGATADSQLDPRRCEAFQLTGGYVDWLRANVHLLEEMEAMTDEQLDSCADLGEFAACLRARPGQSKTDEPHDAKEMPTRLTKQFTRMAMCLAVVLNKPRVDQHVMDVVRTIAVNTSVGVTLKMVKHLLKHHEAGMSYEALGSLIDRKHEKTKDMLRFMRSLGMVRWFDKDPATGEKIRARWQLTDHMKDLYELVMVRWSEGT